MKTAIIYANFFNPRGTELRIGGVETYLSHLGNLIAERGGEPILFQAAEVPFEKQVGPLTVVGVASSGILRRNIRRNLFQTAVSRIRFGKDVLIFGSDQMSVPVRDSKCILIQHGIGWDLPETFQPGGSMKKVLSPRMHKRWAGFLARRHFGNCPNRVCVDYNFPNWYRTQVADGLGDNTWVIPNFVAIPPGFSPSLPRSWQTPTRIIFARRFVDYRGSRLMAAVAAQLLARHTDIEFSFAGEGPDEEWLKNAFADEPRVTVMKYSADDALQIHSEHDIAVVPSLGSEGTSLSLAEAMAAGCAVVATNIGGMTNMVIDGYNGSLVNPNEEELVRVLENLIADPVTRQRLARKAFDTAHTAFSLQRWKEAWTNVLATVEQA